jgi:hypothetical protein
VEIYFKYLFELYRYGIFFYYLPLPSPPPPFAPIFMENCVVFYLYGNIFNVLNSYIGIPGNLVAQQFLQKKYITISALNAAWYYISS